MEAQNRIRLLYVMDILMDRTDADHRLNAPQILEILEREYFVSCDRRTLYSEIETLRSYGLDVCQVRGKGAGYYMGERRFSMTELKVLVDAVQSSRFIPQEEARSLIKKLEKMCSRYDAARLGQQVTVVNRPRPASDESYAYVETLHDAIYEKKKISFRYMAWDVHKQLVAKHGGNRYKVSPLSLVYDDEKYYLVAFDEGAGMVKHFRVDKLSDLSLLEEKAGGLSFDASAFARKTFGMYGGADEQVVLRGRQELVGTVIDHFGKDLFVRPDGEGYFSARALVTVSPNFFGWLVGLGDGIEIQKPEHVRKAFEEHLQMVMKLYRASWAGDKTEEKEEENR